MGLSIDTNHQSHHKTHKFFLICNYILLGAASSCIFLTLSLRLIPSIAGALLVLLHIITIAGAISGCNAVSAGSNKWYAVHMVAAVLTAIFQGSVSVLIFTTTLNFLSALKSYVKEDDAAVILKMAGGLCVLMFVLEWLVLTLAFFLRYYSFVEGGRTAGKVAAEDEKTWTPPFHV
ncbi:hypothetical protein HanPI659440_Chr11g0431881 [Helianthus annuus]|nr:hypothetical protein HanPI659440_Chr11g0431881 [Helianthus annuus]